MEIYDYINQSRPVPPEHHSNAINSFGTVYRDLYPYSPEDSFLWMELFCLCSYNEMASMLAYIRNVGARLVPHNQFGFMIQPIIDPTGFRGWKSLEHYNQEKQCLTSPRDYTPVLIVLLGELRRRHDAGEIVTRM